MAMHGVLAEDERARDLAVGEPGGDEAQHLGLARAERRLAVHGGGRGVVEEAGERAVQLALVADPGGVRVAAQRHEARVGEQRGELATAADRNRAVAAAVQDERRRRHVAAGRRAGSSAGRARGTRPRPRRRRSGACARSAPRSRRRSRAGRRGRRASATRAASSCGRSRRASAGRLGNVVAGRVAAEEHDLAHALRARPSRARTWRVRRTSMAKTIAGSSPQRRARSRALRASDSIDGGCGIVPVGEPDADAGRSARRGGSARASRRTSARSGSSHSSSRCADPAGAEDEQRPVPDRRVGEPPSVDLAEADLLLHHPQTRWPERAMSRRWPATAKRSAMAGTYHAPCTRSTPTASPSGTLRNGDTETVAAVFARLSDESRRQRFGGAKPRAVGGRSWRCSPASTARITSSSPTSTATRSPPVWRGSSASAAGRPRSPSRSPTSTRAAGSAPRSPACSPPTPARPGSSSSTPPSAAATTGQSRRCSAARPGRLRSTWLAGECALVAALD